MIADLEQKWHVHLLKRSRATGPLTSDGRKLLPFAQTLLEDYRRMQEEVAELNELQKGLIRIHCH